MSMGSDTYRVSELAVLDFRLGLRADLVVYSYRDRVINNGLRNGRFLILTHILASFEVLSEVGESLHCSVGVILMRTEILLSS